MYNLNLEISKDAEFSIIIDPSTNDELVLKGEGQLNTGIEEDGSMGLTGIYKLRSGYYKMNNQFLKNKFVLTPGSTITLTAIPIMLKRTYQPNTNNDKFYRAIEY